MQPTEEEFKRVDPRLHKLHCHACHCSNRTLADRLRRDGAQRWVCTRAVELTRDACESRKAPQPRNHATFENGTTPRSQDGLDNMDPTLASHKTVADFLVLVEPVSQMAVTGVFFVLTDGDGSRNDELVRKRVHYPRPVAVRFDPEKVFCVTWVVRSACRAVLFSRHHS